MPIRRATIELEGPETIAAVITEPILMSAGIVVPPDRYLRELRALCDEHNILLIFDEIITGFGRTGPWFAAEHSGVWPDLICCGKGDDGRLRPLSAIFMTGRVAAFWGEADERVQFYSGHTYGANPVACAAALAVLDAIESDHVIEHCAELGDVLASRLRSLVATHPSVGLSRGRGLLQGLVMTPQAQSAVRAPAPLGFGGSAAREARRRGMLLRASPWFVAVAPPLVTTKDELDEIVDILDASLSTVEETLLPAEAATTVSSR